MWLMNYSDTSYAQPMLCRSVVPNRSSSNDQSANTLSAGLYHGTGGITQIKFKPGQLGAEFMSGTSWVVYGINGAS